MRFGRIGMTRPEKFPKPFNVYRPETTTSEKGRLRQGQIIAPVLSLRCILSDAKPDEVQTFQQLGVTITHSILQRGAPQAKVNDIFKLVKNGKETRMFRVQAIGAKGEMDIDTMYYCEERSDHK